MTAKQILSFCAILCIMTIAIAVNLEAWHETKLAQQVELIPANPNHSELRPLTEDSLAKFRILDARMYEAMDRNEAGDSVRKYLLLSEDIKPK